MTSTIAMAIKQELLLSSLSLQGQDVEGMLRSLEHPASHHCSAQVPLWGWGRLLPLWGWGRSLPLCLPSLTFSAFRLKVSLADVLSTLGHFKALSPLYSWAAVQRSWAQTVQVVDGLENWPKRPAEVTIAALKCFQV